MTELEDAIVCQRCLHIDFGILCSAFRVVRG